jgi:hypothetical protein
MLRGTVQFYLQWWGSGGRGRGRKRRRRRRRELGKRVSENYNNSITTYPLDFLQLVSPFIGLMSGQ